MGETVVQTQPQDVRPQDKARFVCRGLTVPFILLAVWDRPPTSPT
jgi:hypothetical protein